MGAGRAAARGCLPAPLHGRHTRADEKLSSAVRRAQWGSLADWGFGYPYQGYAAARWAEARLAARSVLTSSIARVIGPTPPGTGVIAPAFAATAS